MDVVATKGIKLLWLIKRKPTTSREELVMHWYKNHMPAVIRSQQDAKAAGNPHAWRYIVTLFDANSEGQHPWDGMAQLWMSYDHEEAKPVSHISLAPRSAHWHAAHRFLSGEGTATSALDYDGIRRHRRFRAPVGGAIDVE